MEMGKAYTEKGVRNGAKQITLWVPVEQLPVINERAANLGMSRTELLLKGAMSFSVHGNQGGVVPVNQ